MCTVSIKVNDNLLHKAWANMDDDVDLAKWMQQQIEAILIRMALDAETSKRQDAIEGKTDSRTVPDVVLSLLGANGSVDDEALQRLMDFAAADPKTITLNDLAGILPAPQTLIEELRDEYIRDNYRVAGHDNESLLRGVIDLRFDDLEDSCQLQAAVSAGCQYLLTFNVKDYPPAGSQIKVVTPEQFLIDF